MSLLKYRDGFSKAGPKNVKEKKRFLEQWEKKKNYLTDLPCRILVNVKLKLQQSSMFRSSPTK